MRFLPLAAILACAPVDVDAEVLTTDAITAWLDGDLEPVTDGPTASMGAPGSQIEVWTRPDDLEIYRGISANVAGSGAQFDVGATVVREVLDETGEVAKITVLVKAPHEAHEELGGWVFGVYTPAGVVLSDEEGVLAGALPSCTSCHLARAQDDFLFGMP